MKVTYGDDLSFKTEGLLGSPQEVNIKFMYRGLANYIPTIYKDQEGIIFDLITILDPEEVEKKFDGAYRSPIIESISLNAGELRRTFNYRGFSYIGQESEDFLRVKNLYKGLVRGEYFTITRYALAYNEARGFKDKFLRRYGLNKLLSLELNVGKVENLHPLDLDFTLRLEEEKSFKFLDENKESRVTIKALTEEYVKLDRDYCFLRAVYKVKGDLEGRLVFTSSIDEFDPDIIGSTFGSLGIEDDIVYSNASLKRKRDYRFDLRGIYKDEEDERSFVFVL